MFSAVNCQYMSPDPIFAYSGDLQITVALAGLTQKNTTNTVDSTQKFRSSNTGATEKMLTAAKVARHFPPQI
jgi:hypothetical protein